MTKKNESGKSRMIKGSLLYLWEEMKTMNMTKFKALYRIGSGYLRMKIAMMRRPAVGQYRE
ncbi:hypothetical protein [Peredibacter starrii]|uniref:Uncharacterized protein n=1 Tax=Peredibacter starrii TaxID=28202 RepID=A0AAX4HJ16_9BACT|nr:hypothetical protein [Peredibacter starrii]WPU63227.1 hypothetical protein SOO65_11080 [Peredibacter starrii]